MRALISARTQENANSNLAHSSSSSVTAGTQDQHHTNGESSTSHDAPVASSSSHPYTNGHTNGHASANGNLDTFLDNFAYSGEMGPVADISTFPPTMAPPQQHGMDVNMLSMDSILSADFWDSVLVPGAFYGHQQSVRRLMGPHLA